MSAQTPTQTALAPTGAALAVASVRRYITAAKAPATLSAYRSDWSAFSAWCIARCVTELPATPETIATYMASLADDGVKYSTIRRRMAAISKAHEAAGHSSPCSARFAVVGETLHGIARTHGTAQTGRAPLLDTHMRRIAAALPQTTLGTRDRALLLLGFAGGFRRSELAALDVADVEFTDDGLVVTIRRSKTDQVAAGRKVGIPFGSTPQTCPVRAVRSWLTTGITEGALFRAVNRHAQISPHRIGPQAVWLIVKRVASLAGLEPGRLGAHSLRSGLATSAARAGKSERAIMAQTGHRSVTVLRGYIRDGCLFTDNAAAGLL